MLLSMYDCSKFMGHGVLSDSGEGFGVVCILEIVSCEVL